MNPAVRIVVVLLLVIPACEHGDHAAHEHEHGEAHPHDKPHDDHEEDHEGGHHPREERGASHVRTKKGSLGVHRHEEREEEEGGDHDDDHRPAKHADDGEEEAHEEEGVIHLAPSALERSGIRVAPVTTGALRGVIEVPAEIQLNPDRVAHISPLVEGQLVSVQVTQGDHVEVEQEIARLRSVTLGQARAELSRTTALRKTTRKNRDRQKKLRSEGISSERAYLEAELAFDAAKADQEAAKSKLSVYGLSGGTGPEMTLKSPIAGIVLERHATRGENISPTDTLFIVADLSKVWVIGRVYEQHIGEIGPGMTASLTLNAYPSRNWGGKVDFVGTALDEETRTLPVRVELDNPAGLLRPGLFGTLRLSSNDEEGDVVLVPETAIQTVDDRPVVFVPGEEEGEFEVRPVTLGRSAHAQAEVLEGLEPGSAVVVDGGFILKSELMRSQLGHGHAH